jgi:hypothetical protein
VELVDLALHYLRLAVLVGLVQGYLPNLLQEQS